MTTATIPSSQTVQVLPEANGAAIISCDTVKNLTARWYSIVHQDWHRFCHGYEFCQTLLTKSERVVEGVCAFSALDTTLMISSHSWHKEHDLYAAGRCLHLFVLCRVTVIVLIMALQAVHRRKYCRNPAVMQGFVTVGVWVAVLLVCVSYAAVTVSAKRVPDSRGNRECLL